jgi:hypothetical protein
MEPKIENKKKIQFIMLHLWFFKNKKLQFQSLSIHLLIHYIVFAPITNAYFFIFLIN